MKTPITSHHLPGLYRKYLSHIRDRAFSNSTVNLYINAFNSFDAYLSNAGIDDLRQVTRDHLAGYRKHLAQAGFSDRTVDHYLGNVRRLFQYLEAQDLIFLNPAADLRMPRCRPKPPHAPTEAQVLRLLNAPDTRTPAGVRDRALLETAYTSGARRRELYDLTIFDPDLDQGALRIFGKGDKERVVPLGKAAVLWLTRYLVHVRPMMVSSPDETALWINELSGERFGYEGIYKMIREYALAAGIGPVSPHDLRRACATHMLRNGAEPVHLQALLGHATLKHLSRYLQVTRFDMKQMHERSKPGK